MQSYVAPPDSSMASGIAVYEGNAGRVAQADSKLSRTLDRLKSSHRAAVPKMILRERLRHPLLILFLVILAAFGTAYYLVEAPYVSTDDAFVREGKESVNARVAGQVVEIAVPDYQRVQQGQHLFQIAPEPYRIAVDHAAAQLASANLQIETRKITYRREQADLQSARDSVDFDQREFVRRTTFVTDGWTPREDYDRADMDLKVAGDHIASDQQQIANAVAALDANPNIEIDLHPPVRAAKAKLDRARRDLSYAMVTAPGDGIVAPVNDLQVGQFVYPRAAVFFSMRVDTGYRYTWRHPLRNFYRTAAAR